MNALDEGVAQKRRLLYRWYVMEDVPCILKVSNETNNCLYTRGIDSITYSGIAWFPLP